MRGGIVGANRSDWGNIKGRFANDEQKNNETKEITSNKVLRKQKLEPSTPVESDVDECVE